MIHDLIAPLERRTKEIAEDLIEKIGSEILRKYLPSCMPASIESAQQFANHLAGNINSTRNSRGAR